MSVVVELSHPIKGMDGNDIKSLNVKPITTAMYFDNGDLFVSEVRTNGDTETIKVSTDMRALRGYMAAVTGLPDITLMALHPKDAKQVKGAVEDFFQDFM